jgi:hypothetical protein
MKYRITYSDSDSDSDLNAQEKISSKAKAVSMAGAGNLFLFFVGKILWKKQTNVNAFFYIRSGTEIPNILHPFANTVFAAKHSDRRAFASSISGITTRCS